MKENNPIRQILEDAKELLLIGYIQKALDGISHFYENFWREYKRESEEVHSFNAWIKSCGVDITLTRNQYEQIMEKQGSVEGMASDLCVLAEEWEDSLAETLLR